MTDFEAAVVAAAGKLGPDGLRRLAASVEAGRPVDGLPPEAGLVLNTAIGSPEAAAAYVRGVAAGYEHRAARVQAELVWTGPYVFDVPVRATAQVLIGLVDKSRQELILTTYSAKPYLPLLAALRNAVDRGVAVWIVVETLHGAGNAMQGEQPAKAFANLHGVELWSWALDRRPESAKMHAKIAVADERILFVTSANLTTSGIGNNIEAGILVHGGNAAARAAEHLRALRRDGHLIRI